MTGLTESLSASHTGGFDDDSAWNRELHVRRIKSHLQSLHTSWPEALDIIQRPEAFWRVLKVWTRSANVMKERTCYVPEPRLSELMVRIARRVHRRMPRGLWNAATAFMPGCSIFKNALLHVGSRSCLRIDLANAYESVQVKHIASFIRRLGIGRSYRTGVDLRRDIAWVYARLLTYRGHLRQGASASPLVFNMLMDRLDNALVGQFTDRANVYYGGPEPWRRIAYTRYADDLCFSSPAEQFPFEAEEAIWTTLHAQHVEVRRDKVQRFGGGIFELPGVLMERGKIRPQTLYVKRLVESLSGLTPAERSGHRGFLAGFTNQCWPHAKKLRVLRSLGLI